MVNGKILIVDDEPDLLCLLQEWLEEEGYTIHTADNGSDALRQFFTHRPTLVIVDLRLPGMDGFQLIGRMRELSDVLVLVLSALGDEESVIHGLDMGADEYLVKPVSRRTFLARVRALLRRATSMGDTPSGYADPVLSLDFRTREAAIRERPLHLRPTEFRLLTFLALNSDRVITHDELLERVWGTDSGSLDSVKWYVASLRKKVEQDPQNPQLIVSVRGLGYRYLAPEEESPAGE